jgi:hypothetical protein
MPFTRAMRCTPLAAPEGVHFYLSAVPGRSRLVHCIATRAGLEFLADRQLTIEHLERAFYAHRDRIEEAARRKCTAASVRSRVITLTAGELGAKDLATPAQPWIAGRAPTPAASPPPP